MKKWLTYKASCSNLLIFSCLTCCIGNLQCEGETLFEQQELCHYTQRESCAPPAKLILEKINISQSPGSGRGEDGLCTCKFSNGKRVCADSKCTSPCMTLCEFLLSFSVIYSWLTFIHCLEDSSMGVNPAHVLHIASLIILTAFMIEVRILPCTGDH